MHNGFFLMIRRREKRGNWPSNLILDAFCERLYIYLDIGSFSRSISEVHSCPPSGINTAGNSPIGNCGVTTPHELPQVDEDDDEDKVLLVLDEVDFVGELDEKSSHEKLTEA